ncbi:MAG TPA: hypothetical protein VF794_15780 [Archangium sp.]|uniref:hypothetical protein n=1 Tax=Archangium sp. TaxID=1872627 RepID=UPI002ED849C7
MAYGQFWDIRVTYGGAYDFAAANVDQMRHQLLKNANVQLASGGDRTHVSLQVSQELVGDTGYTYETGTIPLAAGIYRASYVPIVDIEAATKKPEYAEMVRWVAAANAPGRGKIRINAHGDGMGNFYMANADGAEKYLSADKIADWLIANGLAKNSKLKTLNLAICLAAQGPKGVAEKPLVGRLRPALNSSVSRLAKRLGAKGCAGIKVTGSNEVVQDLGGQLHAAVMSKSLASLAEFLDRGDAGEFIVRIPQGWTVTPGEPVTLRVPSGSTVTPGDTNADRKPAGGWLVQVKGAVDFTVPQGWHLQPGGFFGRTTVRVPFGLVGESAGDALGGSLTLSIGQQGQVRDARQSYFKAEETS